MTTRIDPIIDDATKQLKILGTARRGQLSKQFFARKTADGKTVQQGPYYVWQRSVKGRKVSVRIPPEQIEQVQADLRRGKQVQAIFESLFKAMEDAAAQDDVNTKKKYSKRVAGKRRMLST